MTVLIRAAALYGYEEMARDIGVAPEPAMQRVHLSASKLADADNLVPYLGFIQLLEHTAQEGNCPDFGLRLAYAQSFGRFGQLALLLQHASTLGEALKLASRYIFFHTSSVRLRVLPVAGSEAALDLVFELNLPKARNMKQIHELALGNIVKSIFTLGQGSIRPLLARLPHAQLGPTASYLKTLQCDCEFNTNMTAIRLDAQSLQQALPAHNPDLQAYALHYLKLHFGDDPATHFSDRIRGMLRRFLSSGRARQSDIAHLLAIHPRTLQRRLAAEGTRFEDLLDEVRKKQFRRILEIDAAQALSQVAWLLGYTEQSSLNRSCLRWFACSPATFREKLQRGELAEL